MSSKRSKRELGLPPPAYGSPAYNPGWKEDDSPPSPIAAAADSAPITLLRGRRQARLLALAQGVFSLGAIAAGSGCWGSGGGHCPGQPGLWLGLAGLPASLAILLLLAKPSRRLFIITAGMVLLGLAAAVALAALSAMNLSGVGDMEWASRNGVEDHCYLGSGEAAKRFRHYRHYANLDYPGCLRRLKLGLGANLALTILATSSGITLVCWVILVFGRCWPCELRS